MTLRFVDRPTARTLPPRPGKPVAIVVHTTGDTDLDKILRFYTGSDGLGPHYCIALDGTIYRIAAEDRVAWHAATTADERAAYAQGWQHWRSHAWKDGAPVDTGGELPNYRAWRDTWLATTQSPLDLVTGAHPNYASVGIELQQPEKPGPAIFGDVQYEALAELALDVGERNGITLDRRHVLGHYDVSPMQRSTARGGWDPGDAFAWGKLWDLIGQAG